MKTSHVLLVVSLTANVAIAWLLFRQHPTPTGNAMETASGSSALASGVARPPRHAAGAPTDPATPQDFTGLRDQLRAMGFSADTVRRVILAAIQEPRQARQRAMNAAAARQPWWQGGIVAQNITPDEQKELRALRKAERELALQVLGPSAFLHDADLERYGFLPADKATQLLALEQDYNDLRREATEAAGGSAQERQKLLTAEYERDLEALLTPEERAALKERDSTTARSLSYRFEYFNATEAEYRAVFALQEAFDAKYGLSAGGTSPMMLSGETGRARGEAQRQLEQDIKAALGDERYAAYLQAQRSEFRALGDLQKRFNVPQPALDQVIKVHADTSAAGLRIAGDNSLSVEQKKSALTELASQARVSVQSALGAALGKTYLDAAGSSWIGVLERGGVYSSSPTGGTSVRMIAGDPPSGVPPPPSSAAAVSPPKS